MEQTGRAPAAPLHDVAGDGHVVPDVWREMRRVESFDIDAAGRLRPQALFAYLLNGAWNHASGTPYGHEELTARGLFWVLTKVQILVRRAPGWGERILLETWSKEAVRLSALRDYAVSSEQGEKLVSATTVWMILDHATGRPQRFSQAPEGFPWRAGRDELETSLRKVPEVTDGAPAAQFRVRYSDIDVNRHVNSARYLQWMVDSHPHDFLEASEPRAIEISFLGQALPDDEVVVHATMARNHELLSIRRAADGRELCRGRFEWHTVSRG